MPVCTPVRVSVRTLLAPVPVRDLLTVIGMRPAVPSVRTTHAPGIPTARPPSSETGQCEGDGLSGVVLCGAHDSILHAT